VTASTKLDLPTDATDIAAAAVVYASLEFAVVPLFGIVDGKCTCGAEDCDRSAGKHPLNARWQKQASSDVEIVRERFRGHHGNIGLVLGTRFVAIEVDGAEGLEALGSLGPMPDTLTSQSAAGEHRIFAFAQHQDPAKVTNRIILPHLRTKTGQVVVAPSRHKSGHRYRWSTCMPPATLPDAVYDQLTQKPLEDAPKLATVTPITQKKTATPPPTTGWKSRLIWEESKKGHFQIAKHAENAVVVLRYHPDWEGRLRFDTHSQTITVTDPPWHESDRPAEFEGTRTWSDNDTVRLSAWIKRSVQLDLSAADCDRAVQVASEAAPYHPVLDYFESLTWDQSPRLSRAAVTYFGAKEDLFTSLVFRWWMIAAVARTYRPGCKADNILILEGPQGLKKSSALQVLASPKWFSDTPIDLSSKDAFLSLHGKLIVELAELESLRRADAARAKAFFTSATDSYRPPYGRRNVTVPRCCVFAGTVNPAVYLQDPTGNRRYWPVRCTKADLEALERDRDQLWAEAVSWFKLGMRWWPQTPEELAACEDAQAPRAEGDEWEGVVATFLRRSLAQSITVGELLEDALGIKKGDWGRAEQMRVSAIMQRLGYERRQARDRGERTWKYELKPLAGVTNPVTNPHADLPPVGDAQS
jgi:predicted P-loop ATPase